MQFTSRLPAKEVFPQIELFWSAKFLAPAIVMAKTMAPEKTLFTIVAGPDELFVPYRLLRVGPVSGSL